MSEEAKVVNNDEKNWAMFCHLGGLFGFIPPLVIWLMKKDEFPMVDREGKKALNFQILMTIAFFVAFLLTFVLIGVFLFPLIAIFSLVCVIMAAVKVSKGEEYNYPINVKFIS